MFRNGVATLALLVLGLVLIGLGLSWNSLLPSSVYWGPQQAEELMKAQANYHEKTHNHGTQGFNEGEFAAARERLVELQKKLASAQSTQGRLGTILLAIGVLLSILGIGRHFAVKQAA
jgi:hypothetical protein